MLSGKEALSIIESEFPQLNYGVKLKDAWQVLERVVEIANSAQQLKDKNCAEIIEQLKKAISLLNSWMDNPDEDLLLHHTDTFVREVTQKYEYPCKEFLPGSKKCPLGNKPECGERSCLLPE